MLLSVCFYVTVSAVYNNFAIVIVFIMYILAVVSIAVSNSYVVVV